ncbi:flagellar hook assembly protein FlgD [Thiovibrio sp. JS02]
MSTIDSTSSGVPTATTSFMPEPVGKASLDRNDFMTLFITQMQHQDPLEPMDSYEMASQLAQFSNMEATMKMSDNMEKLLEYQTSQNNLQLLTLIDKEVQGYGNSMGVVDGKTTSTEFTLADAADTCSIEIYDAAGRMVDTVKVGYAASGTHELSWDAVNPNGETVPDGLYTYKVNALNSQGQKIDVDYRTTGRVTGVQFDSGVARVSVDNHISMNVSDVLVVK